MKFKLKIKEFTVTTFILVTLTYIWLSNFSLMAKAPVVDYIKPSTNFEDAFSTLLESFYSEPLAVEIKAINLNVAIEPVGIETDGSMGVPVNFFKVGWLKTSSKLGQKGNLVLSGHFDTNTGAPAVFYHLDTLKKDDIVKVTSQLSSGVIDNREYIITDIFLADPNNNDHVAEAYKVTEHPTITIITCNGIWNTSIGEYSHRVVVKGVLKEN